jgi:mannose-1-phosphate guanylyltransferase
MLPAMVLAAGLGTRLRPLTERRAKPLVPVGDRPALAHILERLRSAGVPRAVVNAHHHADQVAAFVRAQPWDVAVSEETELLGTAGGLARPRGLLGEGDVIVWNGDILAEVDLRALVEAHRASATLVVQPLPPGKGSVGVDAAGRVVRLRSERFGPEATGGEFLGIYVLGADLRERLPDVGGMIEDVMVPGLARGAELRAMSFEAPWHDIGTVASYRAANVAWLEARGLDSWTGREARVGTSVTLRHTVAGEGASIEGTGIVGASVVWPGAHATAPLDAAVVTS